MSVDYGFKGIPSCLATFLQETVTDGPETGVPITIVCYYRTTKSLNFDLPLDGKCNKSLNRISFLVSESENLTVNRGPKPLGTTQRNGETRNPPNVDILSLLYRWGIMKNS